MGSYSQRPRCRRAAGTDDRRGQQHTGAIELPSSIRSAGRRPGARREAPQSRVPALPGTTLGHLQVHAHPEPCLPLTVWLTTNCGKFFKRWEYQTT